MVPTKLNFEIPYQDQYGNDDHTRYDTWMDFQIKTLSAAGKIDKLVDKPFTNIWQRTLVTI